MNVINLYPPYYEQQNNTQPIEEMKGKLDFEAPEIPADTCPYINFVQQILDEITDQNESQLMEGKIDLARNTLDYIRQCNEALRESSLFWRTKFMHKGKKKS